MRPMNRDREIDAKLNCLAEALVTGDRTWEDTQDLLCRFPFDVGITEAEARTRWSRALNACEARYAGQS